MSRPHIKEVVSKLLKDTGTETPPIDVAAIARMMGAKVQRTAFDDDVSGVLYRDGERIIIGVNQAHPETRQRFTIAHELGHLILHKEEFYVDRQFTIRKRDGISSLAVDIDEIEANTFAAELLMPLPILLKDVREVSIDYEDDERIKELALKYNVSRQAMTFRLMNLALIEPQW